MGPPSLSQRAQQFLSLSTRQELSQWLGTSDRDLRYILYRLDSAKKYTTFTIKKRNGADRSIDAPHPALKHLQRKLMAALSEIAPASGIAKGYVKGRSIVDHAKIHRHKRVIILADLKDFFPSITFPRVRGALLAEPFSLPAPVATCVAQLCCKDGVLPQGGPTSPVLSNLICRSLDHKLMKLAKAHRLSVSRYADDICFSTSQPKVSTEIIVLDGDRWVAGKRLIDIVESSGFELNNTKFQLRGCETRQLVTGLIVNHGVSLPRQWRRQLRVLLHLIRRYGEKKATAIAAAWSKPPASRRGFESIEQVVRGKSHYAQYIDARCGRNYSESLFRSYPSLRPLLPRPLRGIRLRLMAEGKTDLVHLEAAHRSFAHTGNFTDIVPRFLNFSGDTGDIELLKTLYRIAKSDIPELTIGVFDSDNPKIMKETGLHPGNYVQIGRRVFAACLAPASWLDDVPFCIELLYKRIELCAMTADSRRIFLPDEFDAVTGLSHDGLYERQTPMAKTLIVSDKVTRLSDGYSSLLSKADFAAMVSKKLPPFDTMCFDGFRSTFDLIESIVDVVMQSD